MAKLQKLVLVNINDFCYFVKKNCINILFQLRDEVVDNYKHSLQHGKTSTNRCRLCNVDFELIKNWNSANISGDDVYSLTAQVNIINFIN